MLNTFNLLNFTRWWVWTNICMCVTNITIEINRFHQPSHIAPTWPASSHRLARISCKRNHPVCTFCASGFVHSVTLLRSTRVVLFSGGLSPFVVGSGGLFGCVCVPVLMDIWVRSGLGLWWIKVLWTSMYKPPRALAIFIFWARTWEWNCSVLD